MAQQVSTLQQNMTVNKNFRLSIEINQFKDNRMYFKDSLSFSIINSASK